MTFYEKKLQKLQKVLYKNQSQIDAVIAVKNFVDRNYKIDLNLNLISENQSISKYHLIRLFKKYYGLTPRQYLINKRIEKSKEHLANGMTVTETCYSVGFASLGSFSVLFKTKTGKTPAQFKKSNFREAT